MNDPSVSGKLYGRESEKQYLINLFNRICNGEGVLLSIPGHSGIGKTSLVNELKDPVQAGNGVFISGKFEQYQQNIPYFAIQQALTRFAHHINTSDKVTRNKLISRAKSELGKQGKVLTDFIPEFEKLLGKQSDLGDISPQEARHRFFNVIRNFLKAVCLPEHPVVIFIDDWQWADLASLEFLKNLGIGSELRYLMLVASYRDNEVGKSSLLLSTLDEIEQGGNSLEELKVVPISFADIKDLVQDTFLPGMEEAEQLSDLIYKKTEGNPFFVRSLLDYLVETGFVFFLEKDKRWSWKIEANGEDVIPVDIVELFLEKLKKYDEDARGLISLAACLGNSFNLNDLAIISGRPHDELEEMLHLFVRQGMIRSLHGNELELAESGGNTYLTFMHDRLQQAAYSLISKDELASILLKIGRLLLAKLPHDQLELSLFEVVSKINAGYELIDNKQELLELVRLNIRASGKAFASTAYSASLDFFKAAGRIIDRHSMDDYLWKDEYDMYMQYHKERAESEFLEGHYAKAEKSLEVAILNARTPIEKADIYNNLIVQLTLQARYPDAIDMGRKALKLLGISLPDREFDAARDIEINQVYALLQEKNIAELTDLPHMTDPEMLRATKLLITMGPPCYRSHQRLWSVIVPIVVRLSLKYGNIPQAGYSHTAFAGLLIWVYRDFVTAKKFTDLATKLMEEQFRDPAHLSVFYLMIGSSSRHWFEPMTHGSKDYREAYEIGLRSGNLQYAAYAFGHNMYSRFFQGMDLSDLIEDTQRSLSFGKTRHNQWAIDLFEGGLKVFHSLYDPSSFLTRDEAPDDEKYLEVLDSHHNIQVLCIYKILRTYSLLICGRLEEGLKLSVETDSIVYTVGTQGLLPWPEHLFLRYLLLTGLYPTRKPVDQKSYLKEAEDILVDLKKWAEVSPRNFKHKYFLALAEMAKIKGEIEAFNYYEKAIGLARKDKFLQWEAIANERAALYWRDLNNETIAYNYWKNAYVCFEQWGAKSKLILMKEHFREVIAEQVNFERFKNYSEKSRENLKLGILEKQLSLLDTYAEQAQQSRLQASAANYAAELASAAIRLREEIKVRKEVEMALTESEEKFRSLFSRMSEGVALHEFVQEGEKVNNYRIVDVNPSFLTIMGIKRENVVGKLATEAYGVGKPPYFEEYYEVFKTQNPLYIETYNENLEKHFSISAVPWRGNGFATIFSDISLRIFNEERVRKQNEELQKINQEKDKFFSIISHDLKSPLSSIKALTDIFIEQIRDRDINWIERYAGVIRKSVANSEELLANLIEWSQSQTGRMNFKPETIQLNELLDEVKSLFQLTSSQKEIEILCAAMPGALIYGDRAMISTILRNLVSNSIKFSNRGGKIHVDATETSKGVEISVRDSGVGINPVDLDRLFRLDESFTRKGTNNESGTGLGLILCKDFVEKHNGKIWAESEEGKGTVFCFSIPAGKTENAI